MKSEIFKLNIGKLQKYYNHQLDDDIYKFYFDALKHLGDDSFMKVIENIIKSSFRPTVRNPFPLIADFLKEAGESLEDRAVNITGHVKKAISKHGAYESLDFGDSALHATIRGYGGWQQICKWTYDDWKMKETAFINSYKASTKINTSNETHLVGIHEGNNIGRYNVVPPKQFLLGGVNNTRKLSAPKPNKEIEDLTNSLVNKLGDG